LAKRRRSLKKRPIRAPSSDLTERKSGRPFLTSLLLFSTPPSHLPAAVEVDGPLVVAGTVAVELTAMDPLLPTRLPLDRPPKAQSRHLEIGDATNLARDVPLLFPRSRDGPLAPTPVLLMHARLPRHPSAAVELATERRTSI
jgi:hypothetical protein